MSNGSSLPSLQSPTARVQVPARLPFTKFVPSGNDSLFPTPRLLPFLLSPDGRESALRLIQYSLRLSIHLSSSRIIRRLLVFVSLLSASRRLIALLAILRSLLKFSRGYPPLRFVYPLPPDRKGKGRATPPPESWTKQLGWTLCTHVLRESLELAGTLADNAFLFSRLRILPLSEKRARQADKFAETATLLAVMVGLMQVGHARGQIWREGRAIRKGVVKLEARLERVMDEVVLEDEYGGLEQKDEEKRLRERVRASRRALKKLRDELNELWWDRIRLGAEGVFAVYDTFDLKMGADSIRSWSGILSASIITVQGWWEYSHNQ